MESKIFRDIRVCGEHFPDWKAVVDYAGEAFIAKGYAKREYFECIRRGIVGNEAYMVVVPHLVLPHSAPEHGTLENAFHFMKLEHPVESGHESNDPVVYVITFTSVDTDSHVAGISLLAGILTKEGSVERLSRVGSDESLATCVQKYGEQKKSVLKVNTVYINGMGSSLVLKMTVERAFKELGIDAQVTHIDVGQFKDRRLLDVCITTPSLARTIGEQEGMILIAIKNFTDVKTTKEKIREALNIEEQ